MPNLKILLLGPPRVELNGATSEIRRRKGVALLAYLAVTGEAQLRDTMATLFWPESSQREARATLRNELWLLKETLGETWLDLGREAVALRRNSDLWLDVEQFQQGILTGQEQIDPTIPDDLTSLTNAVSLYRDDFLTGFTLSHCPDFDEWQFFQAESLRQNFSAALVRLIQVYSLQGNYETAIPYARRWLALDPLHETAHRQLMQLYAQTGQQAAAMRQYQLCIQVLQEELGISPSPETTAFYENIRTGNLSRQAEEKEGRGAIFYSAPPHPPPLHNLPPQPTPLIGREKELADFAPLLRDPACRLLTVIGPGGIGKTRLAIQAAKNLVEAEPAEVSFAHGVIFVPLASVSSSVSMVTAIAQAANFTFYSNISPQQQLLDYLREKEILLVLDNFEHLLASPLSSPGEETKGNSQGGEELVVELLQAAPALKILVTSRAGLKIQWEQRFPLDGIDFPDSEKGSIQELTQYSAVQLFLQAACRIRPDFELTEDEAPAVAQICRLMQGMPLGILLAAAWIDFLKPTEIAAQIRQSLDFLTSEWRDLPARQQSLRAVFDHSWSLLTEPEQAVFRQMSVFRGGFSYEAAQAVMGSSLQALRALVNKSLLRRLQTGRYELHELLRQYGVEKLTQTPVTQAAIRDRHSVYYCAFVQAREADLKGARQQPTLAEIEADHENIQVAWNWAAEQGQIEHLAQAMDSLGFFYDWRGRFQEGESAFQMVAEKLIPAIETLPTLAKLFAWQALFCRRRGQTEQVHQLFQKSLSCLNTPGLANQNIPPNKAFVLFEMGNFMMDMDPGEAKQLLEQSLRLYQTLGDRWATARTLTSLGANAWDVGRYEEAQQRLRESLALQQELGDQRGTAEILTLLGRVARSQGQLEACEQLQRQSLRLVEKLGDRVSIAQVHINLGTSLEWLGRFSESVPHFEEGLAIYKDLGYHSGIAEANSSLAEAKRHLGWYEQVPVHIQTAFSLNQDADNQSGIGFGFLHLGFVALVKETHFEAQQLLNECIVIFRQIKQQVALGNVLATLGGMVSKIGNFQQAQEYLAEPLQIALETRAYFLLHATFAWVALFLANQGQPERAVEIYTLASRFPYVANSRWFEDMAGRHVVAAAAALPPEVIAAAQERGRAKDAWATAAELLAELET